MNYAWAEPRGNRLIFLFPTQRVGELNHFLIKIYNLYFKTFNF